MPRRQHVVRLTAAERTELEQRISRGVTPARELARARVLLKADINQKGRRLSDRQIAAAVEVSARTVARVRVDFATGGIAHATLRHPPRREYVRKLDGAGEAVLAKLACSPAPPGHKGWSLRLLDTQLVELQIVEGIAPNTVRAVLKKTR